MNLYQLEKLCVEIRAHSRVPNPTIDFWLPKDVEALVKSNERPVVISLDIDADADDLSDHRNRATNGYEIPMRLLPI